MTAGGTAFFEAGPSPVPPLVGSFRDGGKSELHTFEPEFRDTSEQAVGGRRNLTGHFEIGRADTSSHNGVSL